jgi:hypothetical protein
MAKKKYKRMTQKEKKLQAEIRAELRAEGILPPVKPRLNRNKFAQEVTEEFNRDFGAYTDIQFLYKAFSWMKPPVREGRNVKISSEQVGALKVLRLALDIKKFHEELQAKGETKYKPIDLYNEVVAPVLKL